MLTVLLNSHSILRYFILAALAFVIVRSLLGWMNNKPFTVLDNKAGLYLLIFTHLQFLLGLVLYTQSDLVQFNSNTMKNDELRYWAVEHVTIMLIAVVLITLARITSKKMPSDLTKHRRLFVYNAVALLLILGAIVMSGRRIL